MSARRGSSSWKDRGKDIFAGLFERSGMLSALERKADMPGWVMMLHRVLPDSELHECYNPHLALSPESLDQALAHLRKSWTFVAFDEFVAALPAGKTRGLIAVTFDDGWEDNHRCAAPVLAAHNVPALIYLTTGMIGEQTTIPEEHLFLLSREAAQRGESRVLREVLGSPPDRDYPALRLWFKGLPIQQKLRLIEQAAARFPYHISKRFMDWKQVTELAGQGFSFGAHTVSHATLIVEDDSTVAAELRLSRERIEQRLGIAVDHFAYPSGAFDRRIRDLTVAAGYTSSVTTQVGAVTPNTDLLEIPRIPLDNLVLGNAQGGFSRARMRMSIARSLARDAAGAAS